jgi:hypothetical protein
MVPPAGEGLSGRRKVPLYRLMAVRRRLFGGCMSIPLSQKQCIPCRGGVPPLKGGALQPLLAQLESGCRIVEEHHLHSGRQGGRAAWASVNDAPSLPLRRANR